VEHADLGAGGASAAGGVSRRTIAYLLAVAVGLATLILIVTGGSSGNVAYAQSTISAKALTSHECDSTEWHFVITQIATAGDAPASITVTWSNGDSEVVPLAKYTGKTAHYVTTSNLDSTVVSATATIYDGWTGQFNLSHGPCGGPTTPPTEPPTTTQPPS
jgi:hypothetical protein